MGVPAAALTEVREIFREYLESTRELLGVHRKCIIRGWPDRKAAIEVMTRLAYLNCDNQLLRLDYLVNNGWLEREACQSLSTIFNRLNKTWSEGEEQALRAGNEVYREVVANSDAERAQLEPHVLEGPTDDLRRDHEYLKARDALRQKAQSLDERLTKLASQTTAPGSS
jgi:hypothetical protein